MPKISKITKLASAMVSTSYYFSESEKFEIDVSADPTCGYRLFDLEEKVEFELEGIGLVDPSIEKNEMEKITIQIEANVARAELRKCLYKFSKQIIEHNERVDMISLILKNDE